MLTFNFHIGDWLKKTVHLSDAERSAYLALLCRYYDSESPIPESDAYRVSLARTKDQKDAVDYVLSEYFVLVDGAWHQQRADQEIEKYHEKSGKAAASAKARWDKANAMQTQCDGNANALRTQCESDANDMLTTNHEPRTNKTPLSEPASSNCPHLKIVELYNSILADNGLPIRINSKLWAGSARQSALAARWREDVDRQSLEWWERFFKYVSQSDFLMGRTTQPFAIDAGWILKKDNFIKIMEGKYHG